MNTRLHNWRLRPWAGTLALLVALLLGGRAGYAQVDTYTFAASAGTFTPLAGGTNVSAIQDDDEVSAALPIGFSFVFDGATYTQVYANSNGFISFNPSTPGSGSYNNGFSGVAATFRPLAAPFWDDLDGSIGTASYQTTGTLGSRVFTFEWLNWSQFFASSPEISFQVQLVEGSNVVRFIYRQEPAGISGASASIGLAGLGTGASSYLSLSNASASPTASATVDNTSIAVAPATGQVYAFTPPVPSPCPAPRALAVVSTTATSALVSYSVANAAPGPFTIFYGPAGFNPALPPSPTNVYLTMTATGTTATISGLTASTTYQFYVQQNCGGTNGNSTISNAGSFMTACLTPLYATLPVTESFENAWISRCDTRDVPNNSWRNSPATGNNSWRREDDGAAGAWTGPTSGAYTPVSSQGLHSARFHTYNAPSGSIGTLDLFVNLSAAGAKRLSFDFINTTGDDSLVVQLSDDGGLTFRRLAGYNSSATFATQVLPVASTSATAVIRFRALGDYGLTDIGLDNVVLESATGCLTPATLTAATTTTTATLSWLTGGTGTYTVRYGPTGFNPATGGTAVTGIAAPPYTITGLTPGTTYQFYVTLNCASGTNSGTAGPVSFTTQIVNDDPCGATVLTINNTCTPLATTTFGATTTPGTVYGTGGQGGTCSTITAPRDVWFKFTTAATGPTSTAVRISVTGGPASVVSVYAGAACTGPLTFRQCSGVSSGAAAPNLDIQSLTASTTYYVRVSEYSSGSTLGNFTICATPIPNCASPGGLNVTSLTSTSATLTWLPGAAGNTYNVYYGPIGFVPPAGTALSGLTTASIPITGLLPNTGYQFYVQQACGGFNGTSVFSAPFPFTTLLPAPANDEPCGAVVLTAGTPVSSTNVGATTTVQNSIALPACSPASAPSDVWFSYTPTTAATTFSLTGAAAGMVRGYTAPSCSAGPFTAAFCRSSGANNTAVGSITVGGLTAGTRYYIAVSGYGSIDAPGAFTISAAVASAARAQADTNALLVYPNPSNTGQLTLQFNGLTGAGQATLLNALGQTVLTQELANARTGQTLKTSALATGIYTLRVTMAGQTYTRKVVLE